MTSCTPGISSSVPCSTSPLLPVIPIAVRVAPGIGWARYPSFSIFWQTARTCSSVACAFMTTNINSPGNYSFGAGAPARHRATFGSGGCRRSRTRKCIVARPAPQIGRSKDWSSAIYTFRMPRSMAQEQDILKRPGPKRPPRLTSRRIGIHTSSAGGVQNAAERAYRLGCNAFQIFSSSPRQRAPYELGQPQCDEMNRLRARYDLKPLVIHTNYLVNLASSNELFLQKSMQAFRGEVQRALSLCAEYLVLHPGSFRGADREQGLLRTAAAIATSMQRLDLAKGGLKILIENTAGSEFSLGGSFEQIAEVLDRLKGIVPVGACIDTCHTHVAGYDLITEEGFYQTLERLDDTIGLNRV